MTYQVVFTYLVFCRNPTCASSSSLNGICSWEPSSYPECLEHPISVLAEVLDIILLYLVIIHCDLWPRALHRLTGISPELLLFQDLRHWHSRYSENRQKTNGLPTCCSLMGSLPRGLSLTWTQNTLSMFRQEKQWETLKPRGQACFNEGAEGRNYGHTSLPGHMAICDVPTDTGPTVTKVYLYHMLS